MYQHLASFGSITTASAIVLYDYQRYRKQVEYKHVLEFMPEASIYENMKSLRQSSLESVWDKAIQDLDKNTIIKHSELHFRWRTKKRVGKPATEYSQTIATNKCKKLLQNQAMFSKFVATFYRWEWEKPQNAYRKNRPNKHKIESTFLNQPKLWSIGWIWGNRRQIGINAIPNPKPQFLRWISTKD